MRLALLIAALCCATRTSAAGYDGTWRLEFDTQVGGCDRMFERPVEIVGGAAAGGDITGYIASDGLTSLVIRRGTDIFRAQGHTRGAAGSGAWSSNTALCGGRWKLLRRSF